MIRPMQQEDVAASQAVQQAALAELDERLGVPAIDWTEEVRERQHARIAHLRGTDPAGAFVAEEDGEVVGCALALVRDGMWFLSLLMVQPGFQGKGVGRALLDAALGTATGRDWILSTEDPAAVRRYQRAGFALHPSYTAKGAVDRSLVRAVPEVREGLDDATFDTVLRTVRGAGGEPEAAMLRARGMRVLTVPGKGFSVLRAQGTAWLGATDEDVARALLWATLAEAPGDVEVDWLAANQQWAIDVCLDARLTLKSGASLALRGQPPMAPYLPSGAYG